MRGPIILIMFGLAILAVFTIVGLIQKDGKP